MEEQKPLFVEVMGDTPYVRVLDFILVTTGVFDYTPTFVAKEAKVSRAITKKIFSHMEKIGIIVKTRKHGRAQFYGFNKASQLARTLDQFFVKTIIAASNEEERREMIQIPASRRRM